MPERLCQRPGCGRAIPSRKRKDARWCSRSCESKARRQAARKARFEAANPQAAQLIGVEDQSLVELHQRACRPDHWAEIERGEYDPDLLEHTDYHDVGVYEDEHQDDEAGIVAGDSAPDPWQQRNEVWAARQEFANAVEAIEAKYRRRMQPYAERQRRNPGRVLPELAELQRERDTRIAELQRDHWCAEAHAMAARDRPGRIASARERELERTVAHAFARDLGRGRHLRDDPPDAGRATTDIATW